MLIGWRETVILGIIGIALLSIGACLGVLGSLALSERNVATCQALRADAFEIALASRNALNECTCAVTGRCGR
jgi:hypothetical protein